MNVLLLRANPRQAGYTERLTNLFLQGLNEAGAVVRDVNLTQRSITQCDGCYHCWLATPGQCVHSDDMGALLDAVLDADLLVCATPVYYFSMAASMKAFFERLLPLSAPGTVPSSTGLTRNNIRYPERWKGKRLISIVVGALKEPELYAPLNATFRLIADSIDMEIAGQLTRPEASLLDYRLSKPKTLKLIETAFLTAGHEAAQTGRIQATTLAQASLPLAANIELFRLYSTYYWETAQRMGSEALDLSQVHKQVGADVRILLREMVRCVDSDATSRVKAVLEFDFSGGQTSQVFQVRLDRGQCELIEGPARAPDLRIRCDGPTWAGLFTRQINVREALAARKILLEGDKSLFVKLDRYFPPPSA